MKFRNIYILITLIFLASCDQYNINKTSEFNLKPSKKYKNIGFSLVYNDELRLKKLDQRSLQIFHKTLKAKSQTP